MRPRHNSEPYIKSIKDQGDLIKYFLQENQINMQSPAKADENIINKENFMTQELDQEGKTRDPKEEAFLNALHQRKVVTDAMKAGNLSCLPGADGYADTTPAVNLVNGTFYHGSNMLFLKEHTRENGYPTAEYLTSAQIDKAREEKPDLFIRKGEKGISIYVSEQNENTGEYDSKNIRLFNVAQTNKPQAFKDYAEQKQEEKFQEREAYLKTQYGSNYTLEKKQKEPGVNIVCSSTEPEKYLGQYLAAVSMGSKFKVSQEQAAEFSKNMEAKIYERHEKYGNHTNPFSLSEIGRDASQHCKTAIKEAKMEAQKLENPGQKLEQTQSRGHKM